MWMFLKIIWLFFTVEKKAGALEIAFFRCYKKHIHLNEFHQQKRKATTLMQVLKKLISLRSQTSYTDCTKWSVLHCKLLSSTFQNGKELIKASEEFAIPLSIHLSYHL